MPGRPSLRWNTGSGVARRNLAEPVPPETPPVGTRFSTGEDLYLLDGPTSAPGGAVTVNPATDDLQTLTTANPAGTTFYLLAGQHVFGGGSPGVFDQCAPKAGNTYIGAPGAVVNGRNINRYAFTGTAANVTLRYLEVVNFNPPFDEFVVNHDTGDNWTVEYCNFHSNDGAALGLGNSCTVRYSWLHHNRQYGHSAFNSVVNNALSPAVSNVTTDHCEVAYNGDQVDEVNPDGSATGHGRNGACKYWDTAGIVFTNNWVHHSSAVGFWADTNDIWARIEQNLFEDNWGEAIFYEISYNFRIAYNMIRRNCISKGLLGNYRPDGFPYSAIYISESGSEPRIGGVYAGTSEIVGNALRNNWGDITLWENADRFCNSLANTSFKIWKPLGGAASFSACNNPATKNLTVTLTSGSPNFVVTAGTFEYWDEGRPCSGTNIPGGAEILSPSTANNFVGGWTNATNGIMTANASSSGSVTMTLAAGTININPAYYDCRWHTQGIDIHHNTFDMNQSEVLGARNTLQGTVVTGKHAILSQVGTAPSWTPYGGTTIQTAVTFNQNNSWRSNTYRGNFNFMPFDTSNTFNFTTWRGAPYNQDASSTYSATPPTGNGGGDRYKPDPPTGLSATAGNTQARVAFTPPADTGGDQIVGYEATSSPGSFTASAVAGPITVSGLTNTTAYTFTVKARTSIGLSVASSVSGSVTPTGASSLPGTTTPWHPVFATAQRKTATSATVSFRPPASDGGATITNYTATSSPGGFTGTGSYSPITVTGLTTGVAYTFTVTATNSVGTGPSSPATTSVTPI